MLFIFIMTSASSWLAGNHLEQNITENFVDPLVKYHAYYKEYFDLNGFKTWFINFSNKNITGGLIGEFFVSLSFIMQWSTLFIFEIILFVGAFFTLLGIKNFRVFNKVKKAIVHALGGHFIDEISVEEELAGDKKDKKVNIFDANSIKIEALDSTKNTPPLSFLTDTSIDHNIKNKDKATKLAKQMNKIFADKGIEVSFISFNIMPLFTEYSYKCLNEETIAKIFHVKKELLDLFKTNELTIFFKKGKLTIEAPNLYLSKISIQNVLASCNTIKKSSAVVGCTFNSTNIMFDFDKNPSLLIVGKPGSGAIMQASSLIVSSLYVNTPEDLKLMLCSPQEEKTFEPFSNLSHLISSPAMSYQDTSQDTNRLLEYINDRRVKFSKAHCKTLEEYNKMNPNEKLPKILYVLFGLDEFLNFSPNNSAVLEKVLSEEAAELGIRVILYCQSLDSALFTPELKSLISSYFIFKTNDENISEMFMNSSRALKLFGKGDGYMLLTSDHSKTRIQSCYINKEEMVQTLKIINTFYQYKNK